jgi:hypothetical protein
MKDKRFLVFGFNSYYPSGGMEDRATSFDTIEEAYDYASKSKYEHLSFYDREEGTEV